MAVDLGGTNFRVCSIDLHGNGTFSLTQSKVAIPPELMVAPTSKPLFAFLAKQIDAFLQQHHSEHYAGHLQRRNTISSAEGFRNVEVFSMGFTFSFPVRQHGINSGTLIRWTKGFDIPEAVGKDVCALLQAELDELRLPVKVAALVNDTVGTLLARSYTSPDKSGALLGGILGTGTNGAYVEKLSRIKKLVRQRKKRRSISHGHKNMDLQMTSSRRDEEIDERESKEEGYDKSTGVMIVNTEWGSFDNGMRTLPNTSYDVALDAESNNPGIQMFEKRVSGMFLGEILRRAVLALAEDPGVELFAGVGDNKNKSSSVTTTTTTNGAGDGAGDCDGKGAAITTITTTTTTVISNKTSSTTTITTTTTSNGDDPVNGNSDTTAKANGIKSLNNVMPTTDNAKHASLPGHPSHLLSAPAPALAASTTAFSSKIPPSSPLLTQWGLDTSFISLARADETEELTSIRRALATQYNVPGASLTDAIAIRKIASAIGRRAARLAAVALGGVVLGTGNAVVVPGEKEDTASTAATTMNNHGSDSSNVIDIGLDGSLIEFYPDFEKEMRVALRAMKDLGAVNERRVRIGIAKDGSGVGAALAALVASDGAGGGAGVR